MPNKYALKKEKSKIPSSLSGIYLDWLGYKPDKEGVTVIPQEISDLITEENLQSFGGTAFSPSPLMSKDKGLSSEYKAFIIDEQIKQMTKELNEMGFPFTEKDVYNYLEGHELYHSKFLTSSGGQAGNKGYMPTNISEFASPSGMEGWLSLYPQEERGQERGAHLAGMKSMGWIE